MTEQHAPGSASPSNRSLGNLLARNTGLNFIAQVIPLLVGLVTIPYVIRGLGTERFGVLSLAWVLLGYFSILDMGLGRATTKFVAECLGKRESDAIPSLVWTSLGLQLVFGVAAGLLFATFTPVLVQRVLKIPVGLRVEVESTFFVLAASFPVVLATGTLRGVLEAAQRFDLVNYVKLPANISVFLLPAIAVPFHVHLTGIVLLLVLARVAATAAYLAMCFELFPTLARVSPLSYRHARPLVSFGGWVMISNVISPFLVYVDRFVIGSLVSLSAVSYYSAPYEAVMRVSIFPSSLIATLFPAFSSLNAVGAREMLEDLNARAVKFLLLIVGPILLTVLAFSYEILRFWLGTDFADTSTQVLQVLSLGFLINALAFVPITLLQGVGRSDLPAKYHLVQLPVYVVSLWFLVGRMGIRGAALASSLRLVLDACLLFGGCAWLRLTPLRSLAIQRGLLKSIFIVLAFGLGLLWARLISGSLVVQAAFTALLAPLFAIGAWNLALDDTDRSFIASGLERVVAVVRTSLDVA